MRIIQRLIDRVFEREEMDGDGRCATYLVRWTLMKLPGRRGVYLHHFVGDDWSLDLHDHPKRFVSIGLWGSYVEETPRLPQLSAGEAELFIYPCGCSRHKVQAGLCDQYSNMLTTYRAPWIRTFPAEHIHRISLINGRPCWTLVIVLRTVRSWGFWHEHRWVPWRTYVGSDVATKMKSCPD